MTDFNDPTFKKAQLRKQACFAQLTDEETGVLSTLLVEVRVAAGETIVTEGEHVDSVYLIVSGTADVRHVTLKGHVHEIQSIATLGVNDAIGLNEAGFYSLSGIRTATVVAATDMVLLRLSVAAFHGFALTNSHVNEVMRKNADNLLDT